MKVWSPEDARGWIKASDTQPVTDVAAAAAEWAKIPPRVAKLPKPTPVAGTSSGNSGSTQNAGASKPKDAPIASDEARTALIQADGLFEEARTSDAADYAPVIAAYERVLTLASKGSSTYQLAETGLTKANIQAGIAAERANIAAEQARRQAELDRLAQEERDRQRMKDPLMGRFIKRGWLEERRIEGDKRYFMVWDGQTVCEVVVSNGRYDLEQFTGFEIGVMGTTVRLEQPSGRGTIAEVRMLDLYRIEVISGSGARR